MSETCETCRYWSEAIAYADADGLKAVCLSKRSDTYGDYTGPTHSCKAWDEATFGAVDLPWFDGAYS